MDASFTAVLRRAGAILAAALLACTLATGLGATPANATSASESTTLQTKLSHSEATSMLRSAGITWSSSGGCSDRNTPTCTSFEQVNLTTIQGIITLKNASGCAISITGGTETGHASGTYSHWNGYKLDISLSSCINGYITSAFTFIGYRSDGAALYESAAGNLYAREGNHWDITYYNCGGC